MNISYVEATVPAVHDVLELYRANKWSSGEHPELLMKALRNSHHTVTAFDDTGLVGLANAISDGSLVVYYPHLLVHPRTHGRGVGREIMNRMLVHYEGMHQHTLTAVKETVGFYERVGFVTADDTTPMWIYEPKNGMN